MANAPRREILGFWFDPASGQFFDSEDGKFPVSDFTFNDLWFIAKAPFVWGVTRSQPLNPFYAPTKETAGKVFDWAKKVAGDNAQLSLVQEPLKNSLFGTWNFPEWSILAEKTDFSGDAERFNVGLLASSIIRNPGAWPARSFVAELKNAGAWA